MKRNANFDYLRVIAALFVVMIHVNARFFNVRLTDSSDGLWGVYLIESLINIVTRVSIPCFVMMSGAFILSGKRVYNYRSFISHSVYKLFIPFLVMFIYWMSGIIGKAIFVTHEYDHILTVLIKMPNILWFVPMLFGIYILTPIVLKIRKSSHYPHFVVLLLGWALLSAAVTDTDAPYSIHAVISFLAYFVLGDLLLQMKRKINNYILVVIFFVLCFSTCVFRTIVSQYYSLDPLRAFLSPTIALMSICMFLFFKQQNLRPNRWIEEFAGISYFVYLTHTLFISMVISLIKRITANELITILSTSVLVFVLSSALSKIWADFRKWSNKKYKIEDAITVIFNKGCNSHE